MAASGAGLSDEVRADVNGVPHGPARIPDRPAGRRKPRWVQYVVALGMHPDTAGELTVDELMKAADRLEN